MPPALTYARAMAHYYLVEYTRGPAWDHARTRREQAGWDEHAQFMDRLVEQSFVILGGPVGEGDGESALLVVDADDQAAVRAALAEDPWLGNVLVIDSIRRWSVWLTGASVEPIRHREQCDQRRDDQP
jgi:uncharacterized protein YciI